MHAQMACHGARPPWLRLRRWPHGVFVGHQLESAVQTLAALAVLVVAFACQMTFHHTIVRAGAAALHRGHTCV